MSIESNSLTGQDQPQAEKEPGPGPGSERASQNTGGGTSIGENTRRIFICYPRSAKTLIGKFHDALAEALGYRGRSYEVFRDKGEKETERINPGENWREVVDAKLKSSICCVVALVPDLFESDECRREIATFQDFIKNGDKRRFLFPIDFVKVQTNVSDLARSGDEIASLMSKLDRHDFVGVTFRDDNIYAEKTDEIAETIHRRINSLLRSESASGEDRLPRTVPLPSPPSNRRWTIVVAGIVSVLLIAGAAWTLSGQWLSRSDEPSITLGKPLDVALDLVLPIKLRTAPKLDAPDAPETLEPGLVKGGEGNIRTIRLGTSDGTDWYEFEFASGAKRYLEKARVPVWSPLDPTVDLVKAVKARRKPLPDAEIVRLLRPDGLGEARRFGPHRTGKIDDVLWYRIAQPEAEVFFSERDAAGALARWSELSGCLQAARTVRGQSAIYEGHTLEEFFAGEPLPGKAQSADVEGRKWIRYQRRDGSFAYLRFADLAPCPQN